MEDFEVLKNEVLADREARCAYAENRLRRKLAASFDAMGWWQRLMRWLGAYEVQACP
jgi:hypothetical protein